MKQYRSILACVGLSMIVGTMDTSRAVADWKTEANTRIEQIRQRDVHVQVVNSQGEPVPSARIELRQVRKAFPFGAAMGRAILVLQRYKHLQ